MMKRDTKQHILIGLTLIVLRCGLATCAESNELNVVLVTIDTLRADHLGCYGYSSGDTPNIDKLAAAGTRFVYAYAQVPFTLPSHASLLTSTLPMWNGVRDSAGPPLAGENLTLAEVFKQHGYATAAFTAAFVLDSFFQLNQGFDTYYDNFPPRDATMTAGDETHLQRRADEVLKPALEWLQKNGDRKFFTWIHFYDPHHPYDPPEPYRSLYRQHPYDGEIAYVDSVFGKLIQFLSDLKLKEKTVIVLTSDHGEALGDHGESYHGYFVYDSTLRVPLIFSVPGIKHPSSNVTLPASLLDVAPTILQLVGLPRPDQMQGRGLLAPILGKSQRTDPIYSESLFANLHFGWGALRALRLGQYKFILSKKPELFDLVKDPDEKTNLYAENRAMAEELKLQIEQLATRYTRNLPEKAAPRLSEEALNKLRALGYIGAPSEASLQIAADLPDPKEKLNLYNLYLKAASQQGNGKLGEAATTYRKMLELDPTPPIVHHQLGSVYFKMANYPRAVESFQAALKLNPGAEASLLALARTYGEMGKFQEAVASYEHALSLKPDDPANLNNLAVIYMKMGSWEKATQTLERAVQHSSPLKESFYHLGVCYQRQQRLREAIAQFQKAIETDPKFAGAYYNLGIIYAQQGNENGAMDEFKRALQIRPSFAEPHFNLGSIYARRENVNDAVTEFQEALRIRPDFAEAHFNLGIVYARQGRLDDAIVQYKKATSLRPNFAKAHRGLAMVYQQKGMNKEAELAMEVAQKLEHESHPESRSSGNQSSPTLGPE